MQPNTFDRQSLRVWLLLAILGAILSAAGWYRVFTVVVTAQDARPPAQEAVSRRQAVPIEPIAAILEAFRSHDVVGLSAGESRRYRPRFVRIPVTSRRG